MSFADDKQCGDGEVFKTGQSSSCSENKWGDPEYDFKPCTMDYVSRCFCENSLHRRQSDDKCVPKDEC
ncbi:hypothetical protein HPB50_003815 [Hyalomma asiaticum]|uniref:Uncharacterized protein n=1 Tax=Hyalomma asiaticum TaxID=266040 RepID=A0ACB7TA73_HYAAI|nr:hypothetical protein HPB50_003815 [Hyalomma asiaticum]